MKTKDLYLLICWDSYEDSPYQVKKAFTSRPLLIKYLKHNFDFANTKEVQNFIDFDDVYQASEDLQYYVETVPFTYDESLLQPNQLVYVLIEDFDDYCNSLKAFDDEDLCCEYLDKRGIEYMSSEFEISITDRYSNWRIETGRLYK